MISELRYGVKMPKLKKRDATRKRAENTAQRAIEKYREAYQAIYGVFPTVTKDGTIFRIVGHSAGVSLQRLNAMTTQLVRRKG